MYSVMVAQQQAELFCEGYVGWDCFFSPEMILAVLFSFSQKIWCFFVGSSFHFCRKSGVFSCEVVRDKIVAGCGREKRVFSRSLWLLELSRKVAVILPFDLDSKFMYVFFFFLPLDLDSTYVCMHLYPQRALVHYFALTMCSI